MKKFAQGVKKDFQTRWQHYSSDFKDGLHYKSVSSTLFLFFACLAPAITFGGILGIYTNGEIGAVEMILASSICGIIFALISGQPLVILGGTGPMLVITFMLYDLSKSMDLNFLAVYFWVGIWTAFLTMMAGFLNLSRFMKYFTRFTDEIFAALISIIFIYEAIKALAKMFNNLEATQHHDTALLSLLLALGTYVVAKSLSNFRQSHYLNSFTREFLADFGPTIAIACMTVVAIILSAVDLAVLPAPDSFGTTTGRNWLVDPWVVPLSVRIGCLVPAVFVTVLVFLDQNITARLINSPDHKLKKGDAYHWDMLIVGGLIGLCSFFGLPWLVAATVRSLNHVRALASFKDIPDSSGNMESKIVAVKETRITGLLIHILLGVSLAVLALIKQVPMAILYGLFLYMGVVSMKGNQLFERLALWVTDPLLYPKKHYMRRVPVPTIHKFTFIQILALVILWAVKASSIGILFPLFIAFLVPLRFSLDKFFKEDHLQYLDAEEEPKEEDMHWDS